MEDNNGSGTAGIIGFFGLIAAVFIALKLIGIIKWNWIWVLSPVWIPTVILIVSIIIFFLKMRK